MSRLLIDFDDCMLSPARGRDRLLIALLFLTNEDKLDFAWVKFHLIPWHRVLNSLHTEDGEEWDEQSVEDLHPMPSVYNWWSVWCPWMVALKGIVQRVKRRRGPRTEPGDPQAAGKSAVEVNPPISLAATDQWGEEIQLRAANTCNDPRCPYDWAESGDQRGQSLLST